MVFLMFIAYLSISYSYVANIDLFFQYSFINGSLKFEITAKRLYAASQRVL